MLKKLSDVIAETLVEEAVGHVFAVSGGASLHLIHSIADNSNINHICNHQEQASAMAADSYSRVSGNIGVAMATSGPGATNLITGICCSYYDSVPALLITGNASTKRQTGSTGVRQIGFQETPIVEVVKPITKYAVSIQNPNDIVYELKKAIYIAKSGRPGPVLIDVPDDLQREMIDISKLKKFDAPKEQDLIKTSVNSINEALEMLKGSKRPVIIAGWGIHLSNTQKEFIHFAESLNIPVAFTWGAPDLMTHEHDLYIGTFGTHGMRHASFAVQNADVIFSLGSRLDTKSTGSPVSSFARDAKKIMLDIDMNELNKFKNFDLNFDILIHANLKDFFNHISNINLTNYSLKTKDWILQIKEWEESFNKLDGCENISTTQVNPYVFSKEISKNLPDNSKLLIDTGCSIAWLMQSLEIPESVRVFHDCNNTAMGWSIPAAIGAYFASDRKSAVTVVTGDGSFMMTSYELATIMHHSIPIKIFVINNQGYSMIQQTQEQWLDSKYIASSKSGGISFPNYQKIADAYDMDYFEMSDNSDISKISTVIKSIKPTICNVKVDDNFRVIPQVVFGKPNEDMGPLMPRDFFNKSMIVKPVE